MAGRNTPLEPPPVKYPFTDKNGVITDRWSQWMQRLHFLNSNKNQQTITGACAVNLDAEHIFLQGGPYAVTLDPPTQAGIFKSIEMTVHSGSITMALTNCIGGTAATTCTWTNVHQTLHLRASSLKWEIYKQQGVTLS